MNEPRSAVIDSLDLEGLQRLADSMIQSLPGGITIGLVGTLGAGKTRLVQSIAQAAGVDVADVTSPTFTLLQSHTGTITLHHLDAYRVADSDEFLELGVDELFDDTDAWTLVEWADRVQDVMPNETLWLQIEIEPGGQLRRVEARSKDAQLYDAFLQITRDLNSTDGWQS